MEYIEVGAVAASAIFAGITLWHLLVIAPLKTQLKTLQDATGANNQSIQSLEIDHAKLASTLESLAKSIDRLTDKID